MEVILAALIAGVVSLVGSYLAFNLKLHDIEIISKKIPDEHTELGAKIDSAKDNIRDRIENGTKELTASGEKIQSSIRDANKSIDTLDRRLEIEIAKADARREGLRDNNELIGTSIENLKNFGELMEQITGENSELKKRCRELETELNKRDRELQKYREKTRDRERDMEREIENEYEYDIE